MIYVFFCQLIFLKTSSEKIKGIISDIRNNNAVTFIVIIIIKLNTIKNITIPVNDTSPSKNLELIIDIPIKNKTKSIKNTIMSIIAKLSSHLSKY